MYQFVHCSAAFIRCLCRALICISRVLFVAITPSFPNLNAIIKILTKRLPRVMDFDENRRLIALLADDNAELRFSKHARNPSMFTCLRRVLQQSPLAHAFTPLAHLNTLCRHDLQKSSALCSATEERLGKALASCNGLKFTGTYLAHVYCVILCTACVTTRDRPQERY